MASHHGFDLNFPKDWCGEGNGTPLQYSCLETPMDGGAWWAAVLGIAESQTRLSDFPFTFHFHALEKEMATQCCHWSGNPLQCSCLENPRDGGAWWAAVYGVAQSRTQLKWLSGSSKDWWFEHLFKCFGLRLYSLERCLSISFAHFKIVFGC